MTVPTLPTCRFRLPRGGFTLVEAALSSLMIAGLFVAAMNLVAMSSVTQFKSTQRTTSRMLATSLLADILSLPYEDPTQATTTLGREFGESNNKSAFDDIDDYHGWTESPPVARDGTALPGVGGSTAWRRSVTVEWVRPTNLTTAVGSESLVKRITVTVSFQDRPILTRTAIRTKPLL